MCFDLLREQGPEALDLYSAVRLRLERKRSARLWYGVGIHVRTPLHSMVLTFDPDYPHCVNVREPWASK